jgi:hypothetical protein
MVPIALRRALLDADGQSMAPGKEFIKAFRSKQQIAQ